MVCTMLQCKPYHKTIFGTGYAFWISPCAGMTTRETHNEQNEHPDRAKIGANPTSCGDLEAPE